MDTKANVSTVDQKNECDFVWLPSITKFRVKSQVWYSVYSYFLFRFWCGIS